MVSFALASFFPILYKPEMLFKAMLLFVVVVIFIFILLLLVATYISSNCHWFSGKQCFCCCIMSTCCHLKAHSCCYLYIYVLLLLYIYSQTAAAFTLLLALIYAVASCLTWSGLKAVKAAGLWLVLDRCLISHHLVTWNAQWAPLAICSSTESKAYKKFWLFEDMEHLIF